MNIRAIVCIFGVGILLSAPLAALPSDITGNSPFQLSMTTDALLLGSSLVLAGTGFAVDYFSDGDTWDGSILDKSDVNAFDRWSIGPYRKSLDVTADFFQYTAILLPCVLASTSTNEWLTIAVMYAESALCAQGIKENLKNICTRNRPYMYTDVQCSNEVEKGDFDRSFPSGHTVAAFNGATFASYVFASYFPDSKWKIPVIAGSYSLAATTASFRLASGNHFLSDVLAGAAIGTATGFLIPWLHRVQNPDSPVCVNVGAGTVSVCVSY